MDGPCTHGSIFGRIPVGECRLGESQEIKVAKDGRGITLLHNAAAGSSGILSLDCGVGFHENCTTTCWIDAMPALPGFHDHGPFSSLRKNDWMSAKAIAGRARYKRGAKIIRSKQKSKGNFNAKRTYITSTDVVRPFAASSPQGTHLHPG